METIDDMAGLFKERPGMALAMTAFSLSALGLPPFSGFWAKFYVFKAAHRRRPLAARRCSAWWARVVAAFYYLRLIKVMWFDASAGRDRQAAARGQGHRHRAGAVLLPGGAGGAGLARPAGRRGGRAPSAWPERLADHPPIEAYDELDSTNAEARRRAEAGEARSGVDHRRRARPPAAAGAAAPGRPSAGNLAATLLITTDSRRPRPRSSPSWRRWPPPTWPTPAWARARRG